MSSSEQGSGATTGVSTVVHLVRHGEVDNPRRILYGRLPGFHLSEAGRLMAKRAADFLAGRDVTVLRSSPLERAVETAEPIAAEFNLPIVIDDRLIEAANHFEGMRFGVGDGVLAHPEHWLFLLNPFRPSWGEPYADVEKRMLAVVRDAARAARGHEAVCVSHQLPIWTVRRSVEGRRLWHDPRRRQCGLGSVTTITFLGDQIAGLQYHEPSGAARSQPPGA
ncbi:MAG: histidine phosphatase family protein [Actinobacteria bacterium]|nr:histidine phosphatase family protein [Actinomycetota bacterium]MBO0838944.1 histidine phosphatase family protein [Actinomycetota bacterium]